MADAAVSKTAGGNPVWVRLPPSAPLPHKGFPAADGLGPRREAWSAAFSRTKGRLRSFQASRKRWVASLRWVKLRKTPRRMALRWTIENQVSTWLRQLELVGVKRRWKRGYGWHHPTNRKEIQRATVGRLNQAPTELPGGRAALRG